MIYAMQTAMLNSRFTPMPMKFQLPFCIVATLIFLIIFLKRKNISSIIWILICDATLILQFYNDRTTALAVGICEIFLFAVLFVLWIRGKIAAKNSPPEDSSPDPENDDRADIEKLMKSEMQNIVPEKKEDVIGSAFDDDKL